MGPASVDAQDDRAHAGPELFRADFLGLTARRDVQEQDGYFLFSNSFTGCEMTATLTSIPGNDLRRQFLRY
jgi:hypothetical protein